MGATGFRPVHNGALPCNVTGLTMLTLLTMATAYQGVYGFPKLS